jgi:hypothetical protein
MANDTRRITIVVGSDSRAGEAGLNAIGRAGNTASAGLQNTANTMTRVQGVFARLGPGLLASLGVAGLTEGFKKIIGGASNLAETVSKTKVVFGQSAQAILDWSSTSARALGMSQQAALDGASAFGNFFQQIGIGSVQTAEMSKKFVELARDFASFQNAKPEDVMNALQAATRGEYDALQRYVPTVNAAAIQTEALATSGKRSAKALTDAEKATALYNIVTRGAGAATGDFERTATGAANQQRVLRAQLEETAVALGETLLPVYGAMLAALNAIGPAAIGATAAMALLVNRIHAAASGGAVFATLHAAWVLYHQAVVAGAPRMATAVNVLSASMVGLQRAGSALVNVMGGWLGIAVTIATFGIFAWIHANEKAKAAAEEATKAYASYASQFRNGVTPEALAAAETSLIQNEAMRGLLETMSKFSVASDDVLNGLNGDQEARKRVIKVLDEQIAIEDKAAHKQAIAQGHKTKETKAHEKNRDALKKQRDAYDDAYTAAERAAKQTKELEEQQNSSTRQLSLFNKHMEQMHGVMTAAEPTTEDLKAALKGLDEAGVLASAKMDNIALMALKMSTAELEAADAGEVFKTMLDSVEGTIAPANEKALALANIFNSVADAELNAKDKADMLRNALDQLYGRFIDQNEAAEKVVQTQVELGTQMGKNKLGFDLNTATTNENRTAILANRDALEAALLSIRERYVADLAAGESAETARKRYDDQRLTLLKQIPVNEQTTGSVQELLEKYGAIPKARNTDITVTGSEKALMELLKGFALQKALSENWSKAAMEAYLVGLVGTYIGKGGGGGGKNVARAGGGLIPGYSPHSRADNISAMLTANEYVQPVNAVDYYGVAFMDALRSRAIPRELLNPNVLRFVRRLVGNPGVKRPGDGSEGVQFFAAGGLAGGPNWPFRVPMRAKMPVNIAEMQSQFAERGDMMSWLYAQQGKPYGWAQAGPGAYDCSGLQSAIWNKLHGRNPYSHTFSTAGQASFFSPGAGPRFTVGWANAGERGGGRVGHTAGRLWGVGAESTGSRGVRIGSGTTPPESFAHIGHYDNGGMLGTGWTAAFNGTGGGEYVTKEPPFQIIVNVTVEGNVTAEKKLAESIAGTIRNELVKRGRRNGGNTGLS